MSGRTTTSRPPRAKAVPSGGEPAQLDVMQATETATGDLDGEPWVIRAGETFAADHKLVRAYPQYFEPVRATRPAVETTTAFPGESRGIVQQ